MIEMLEKFGSASDIQIASFEKKNGIVLPDDYRAFLRACNGGEPRSRDFAVPGWNVFGIHYFFGLDTGDAYDLQKRLDSTRSRDISEFMSIASDAGGWQVFLGIAGAVRGSIYFIDTKQEDPEPIKIADTFTEFLTRLAPGGTFDDYEYGMPPKKTG
jgi:hypothetical protein